MSGVDYRIEEWKQPGENCKYFLNMYIAYLNSKSKKKFYISNKEKYFLIRDCNLPKEYYD